MIIVSLARLFFLMFDFPMLHSSGNLPSSAYRVLCRGVRGSYR